MSSSSTTAAINEYKFLGNLSPIIHTQKAEIHDIMKKHEKERRGKVRRLMRWKKGENTARKSKRRDLVESGQKASTKEEIRGEKSTRFEGDVFREEQVPQHVDGEESEDDLSTQYDSDDLEPQFNFYPTAEEALGLKMTLTETDQSLLASTSSTPVKQRKKKTIGPRITPQQRMQLPQIRYGKVPEQSKVAKSTPEQSNKSLSNSPRDNDSSQIHLWIHNPRNLKRPSLEDLPFEPTDPTFAHRFLKKQKIQQDERDHALLHKITNSKENLHGLKEEARRIVDALNESQLYKDKYYSLLEHHQALQEQLLESQNKTARLNEKLELWKHQMLTKDSMLVVNMKREESLVRKLRLKVTEHEEISKQFQSAVDWLFKIAQQTHLSSDDTWFLYQKLTKSSQRALQKAIKILAQKIHNSQEEHQMAQLKKNYDIMFETHRRVIMESFALQTEVDPDELHKTQQLKEQFEAKFQSRRFFFTWTTSKMSELEDIMKQYDQLVSSQSRNHSSHKDSQNPEMLQDVSLMKMQHSQLLSMEEIMQTSFQQFLSMNLAESKTQTKQQIIKDVQRICSQCERFLQANNVPDSKRIEVLGSFQSSIRDVHYELSAVKKEHDFLRKEYQKETAATLDSVMKSVESTVMERLQSTELSSKCEIDKLNLQLLYFTKRFNESMVEKKRIQREFEKYKGEHDVIVIQQQEKIEVLRKELKNLIQLKAMTG